SQAAKYNYTIGVGEKVKINKTIKIVKKVKKKKTSSDASKNADKKTSSDASKNADKKTSSDASKNADKKTSSDASKNADKKTSSDASKNADKKTSSDASKNADKSKASSDGVIKAGAKKADSSKTTAKASPKITMYNTDKAFKIVSVKGKTITGLKVGTAKLKCTDGTIIRIKVKKAPKKVTVKSSKDYMFTGDVCKVTPSINKNSNCNKYTYSSSSKRVATVDKKGVVTGKAKGTVTITVKTYNNKKASVKIRVKSAAKLICLTFDDGPGEHTPQMLAALKKYDYHGTFFMVGTQISGKKDTLLTMLKDGHELGMHSWQHDNLDNLTQAQVEADIDKTRALIKKYTGVYSKIMRPPYGNADSEVLAAFKAKGVPCILWNSNIEDYLTTSSTVVTNNILKVSRDGVVLLVHDSHSWSVTGLINALPTLKRQGYELVTVSEFCRLRHKKLTAGTKFFG
ncbi:MAG: polysaccharide deacetylase family protein, partial [Lachnospiraceae bacterium]|nr:polysaccharide deacetylase family protein [Lachnospiraceae bacterium]